MATPLSSARRCIRSFGACTQRAASRLPADVAPALDRLLPVGTLEGVSEAAALLMKHREGRIVVVGDFDADGATSTALVLRALRAWGFPSVDFLVPNRFEFGYGLTPEIVALAASRSPTLIVTGRQWHFERRGRGRSAFTRHGCAHHRSPSARRRSAGGECHGEPQPRWRAASAVARSPVSGSRST